MKKVLHLCFDFHIQFVQYKIANQIYLTLHPKLENTK